MEFNFSHDLTRLTNNLNQLQKQQLPFITSVAINNLVKGLREREIAILPAEIENPTPFTMRAFKYINSTKHNLKGVVYIDTIQDKYLTYQIEGGTRKPNKKAIVMPTDNIKKNQYGNLPRGAVNKMLSNRKKYFSGKPNGKPAGIYEIIKTKKKTTLKRVVTWGRQAKYTKQFHFYEIGQRYLRENYVKEMEAAINRVLRNL